jgi:hypothetical protein
LPVRRAWRTAASMSGSWSTAAVPAGSLRAAELFREFNPRKVVVDARSPARSLLEDLQEQGVRRIVETSAGEMAQACGMFLNAVNDGRLVHRGSPELIAAIDGSKKRVLLDTWAIGRRGSSSDVCPLVAAVLAHHGVRRPSGQVLWTVADLLGPEEDDDG